MGCGKSKERSQGPAPGPPHLLGRARPALRPGGGPPKMEAYEECAGKPGPGAWAWLGGDGAVVAVAAEWEVLEGVYREAGGVPLDGTAAPEGRRVRRTRGGGYAVYGGADGTDHLLPAPGGVEGWDSYYAHPAPPAPVGAAAPPSLPLARAAGEPRPPLCSAGAPGQWHPKAWAERAPGVCVDKTMANAAGVMMGATPPPEEARMADFWCRYGTYLVRPGRVYDGDTLTSGNGQPTAVGGTVETAAGPDGPELRLSPILGPGPHMWATVTGIRLFGYNAPEMKAQAGETPTEAAARQEGARAARLSLTEILGGPGRVAVVPVGCIKEPHGRLLGVLFKESGPGCWACVNRMMMDMYQYKAYRGNNHEAA
jgi:endonuclease YncB( thermonuclease family)